MNAFVVKSIAEMQTINDGTTQLTGAEHGVESFGIQVFAEEDLPVGEDQNKALAIHRLTRAETWQINGEPR
ncbi:MAG: hypothetical protein WCB67_07050 [Solirubrobacteraceae bacterium]